MHTHNRQTSSVFGIFVIGSFVVGIYSDCAFTVFLIFFNSLHALFILIDMFVSLIRNGNGTVCNNRSIQFFQWSFYLSYHKRIVSIYLQNIKSITISHKTSFK